MASLFFLLSLVLGAWPAWALDDSICSAQNSPTRDLSLLEKVLYAALGDQNTGVNHIKFLVDHPLLSLDAQEFQHLAEKAADTFCRPQSLSDNAKIRVYDNEIDAIRHFIGATLLHYYWEPATAFRLLVANEIKGGKALTKGDSMDLQNDLKGGDFAKKLKAGNPNLSKQDVVNAALREAVSELQRKELVVLKETAAGPCRRLSSKKPEVVNDLLDRYFAQPVH